MRTAKLENFIPENIAPKDARRIVVCDQRGNKVGGFGLQNLKMPNIGEKLYSFGAVSDVHLQYTTALSDFNKALSFLFHSEKVDFACVCGDLTDDGAVEDFAQYKAAVGDYEVYEILGNHDYWTIGTNHIESQVQNFTGEPLYYSFTKGDDVFVMVGIVDEYDLFTGAELQWLQETLEMNRNKRCFVFQHVFPKAGTEPSCGNAYGIYNNQCWNNPALTIAFESLMKHYKNVVFFHGHSHLEFGLQSKECPYANYSGADGYKSVHIPALSILRSGDASGNSSITEDAGGSQGYVVDVYENGIHLQGRDFVNGKFLPIASYWIDTALQTVEAGTYEDPTVGI